MYKYECNIYVFNSCLSLGLIAPDLDSSKNLTRRTF